MGALIGYKIPVGMYQLPKRFRLMRWLAGPFILLAVGIGFLAGGMSLTVAALFLATLPAMYSVEIPFSLGPGLHWLRAGLASLSILTIAVIVWSRYSSLPTWVVIVGAIYAVLALPAAGLDVALVMNPHLRQRLYERRPRPDGPISGA